MNYLDVDFILYFISRFNIVNKYLTLLLNYYIYLTDSTIGGFSSAKRRKFDCPEHTRPATIKNTDKIDIIFFFIFITPSSSMLSQLQSYVNYI